jgi:osmotically-inducible protein OsmY
MTTALAQDLRQRLLQELDWEPRLGTSQVDVTISGHGVVTLTGLVKSYAEKVAAERATRRVRGVHAVVNDIDILLPMTHERSDPAIAEALVRALEWHVLVPHNVIEVRVSDGWVRLSGTVDWNFQREAALDAAQSLTGVKGITNLIAVKPRVMVPEIKARIEAALHRNANVEAHSIKVHLQDSAVTLRGHVQSLAERAAAESAAWGAPGVTRVENELGIDSVIKRSDGPTR